MHTMNIPRNVRNRLARYSALLVLAAMSVASHADVWVAFTGPNFTHIEYAVSSGDRRQLRVQDPAGVWTILDESINGLPLSGTLRHDTPEPGTYTYQTRYIPDGEEDWIDQVPRETPIEGDRASGTLLFDESLTGVGIRGVIVPDEKTLTLGGTVFGAEALTNELGVILIPSDLRVVVQDGGVLTLSDGIMATNLLLELSAPLTFHGAVEPQHGLNNSQLSGLEFKSGSSGSSLRNVDVMHVTVASGVTLHLGEHISGWPDLESEHPHMNRFGASFMVAGMVDFAPQTKIHSGVTFQLQQAHQIFAIEGGSFILLGEGGATLDNCKSVYVDPRGGVELLNMTNTTLFLGPPMGDPSPGGVEEGRTVRVRDSEILMTGLARRGTYLLTDVLVRSGMHLQDDAVVEAETVEFLGEVYVGRPSGAPTDPPSSARFDASDSRFWRLTANRTTAGSVTVLKGLFSSSVTVYGGAPAFDQCEFATGANLVNRSATTMKNSLFMERLSFYNLASDSPFAHEDTPPWFEAGASPTIQNNDFVGDGALSYQRRLDEEDALSSPISIGVNYYGDANGPLIDTEPGFLGYVGGHAGARITSAIDSFPVTASNVFSVSSWAASPSTGNRKDPRVAPRFWVTGRIAGQGTFSHSSAQMAQDDPTRLKGRDTLLSLDVLTTDDNLSGVSIYAEWDGQTIYADTPIRLYRDRSQRSPALIQNGRTTVDIVLPGVQADSMPVAVYLDASGTGYPTAPTKQNLVSATLTFADPPARPLRIGVTPVKLIGWGVGDAGPVVRELRRDLPAMLPLPSAQLDIVVLPQTSIFSPSGWLSSIGTLNRLATSLALARGMSSVVDEDPLDFIVAALPPGFIGTGIDGANLKLRRRVLFVDSRRPSAVIHELGHGMGLYLGVEQYDQYPELGLPVSRETVFATEGTIGRTRYRHMAGPDYAWFAGHTLYDVMGNTDQNWPTLLTRGAFGNWLRSHLGTAPGPTSLGKQDRHLNSFTRSPSDDGQRLLLAGAVRATATYADRYEFIPGSVTGFEVDAGEVAPIPPTTSGIWYHRHRFVAYDALGDTVHSVDFYLTEEDALWQSWTASFDVPAGTHSYAVQKIDTGGNVVSELLRVEATGLIANELLQPETGTVIGPLFDAEWSYQAAPGHKSERILHALYYRTDPADPWTMVISPTHETSVSQASDSLPVSPTLSLRLITSDGLHSVEQVVDGLSVPPRAPQVTVLEPRNGDAAEMDVEWFLNAQVVDTDKTGHDDGVWVSSRDGHLGTGPRLLTALGTGTHALVYTVLGNNGLVGSNEVSVTVYETMTETDISLQEAELSLHNRLSDPTGIVPQRIQPGATNSVLLRFRNQGVAASGQLEVFVRPPTGGEIPIADQPFSLDPFETGAWPFSFAAGAAGDYTVRVHVAEIHPPDNEPANNTREWTFASLHPMIALAPEVVQLSRSPSGGVPGTSYNTWDAILTVENSGFTDLTVSTVTLGGEQASLFSIVQNNVTGAPIPPTESATIMLRAHIPFGTVQHAFLRVHSDDPERPVAEALLFAAIGEEQLITDSDGDGLLDMVEIYLGTDPDVADSNGNGINDMDDLLADRAATGAVLRLSGDLGFGAIETGTSEERMMGILNLGNSPLNVSAIVYPTGYSGRTTLDAIPAGGSTNVTVTFTPLAVQNYDGVIGVSSDAVSGDTQRAVSGSGVLPTVATPVFDPDGGTFGGSSVQVTVTSATGGATIRYTTDDTEPTTDSAVVVGPVTVPLPGVLRARAWKDGMTPSVEKSAQYALSGEPLLLSPTERRHAAGASSAPFVVNVTASATWSADTGSDTWIVLTSGDAGDGNGVITYTLEANPSPETRSGTITVSDHLGSEDFTVTQVGNGPVVAWGSNWAGQLDVPHDLGDIQAIAAGGSHNLALKTDGTVVAWGANYSTQSSVPPGLSNVIAVAAGASHSLVLHGDGTVSAWGDNDYGQIAGAVSLSNIVAVSAGGNHNLALRADGTIAAWGVNDYGEGSVPPGLSNVIAVAGGANHSVVLLSNGTVFAWGDDWADQTVVPSNLSNVVAIAAGGWHSLALQADGTIVAWGDHWSGQLEVPDGLDGVQAIAAGDSHNLALLSNGTIVAWGSDWAGEATPPSDLASVIAISASGGSLALLSVESQEEPTTPSGIPISWLEGHSFPTDGSADHLDLYNKGMTLIDEYIADTDPNDPDDIFQAGHASWPDGFTIYFHSSTGRVYTMHGIFDLVDGPWTNVPGTGPRWGVGGADFMTDTNEPPAGNVYRIGVQLP